ncbi:MAG: ABC transporter permease subunit [Tepidanaerobacteraceae bacterium]|jgi:putative spermidine/putrescine transport system permease protein|nr:ABC transporter permease subunit [Tepidanaerobacteraceae bacterium]
MRKKSAIWHRIITSAFISFLLLPVVATLIYSVAGSWQNTLLPDGWTLKWYADLLSDSRFLKALSRSFTVSFAAVLLGAALITPSVFITAAYFPRVQRHMQSVVMLPFVFPGVMLSVGLLRIYSQGPVPLAGTFWLLLGAYFISIIPFFYQGISNSLHAINAQELFNAAIVLGASPLKAFINVILPNIFSGIALSALMSFSVLMGEFVLANLLAGGSYETVQVYLYKKLSENGHIASAIVSSYFAMTGAIALIVLSTGRNKLSQNAFETGHTKISAVHIQGREVVELP